MDACLRTRPFPVETQPAPKATATPVLDAAELSDVGQDKRLTLLVCLVHTAGIRARDEVVSMFCKRMARQRQRCSEFRSYGC